MDFLKNYTSRVKSKQTKGIINALVRNSFRNQIQKLRDQNNVIVDNLYCQCFVSDKNTKALLATSIQTDTKVERYVSTIRSVPGGRTQYGNFPTNELLMLYLQERSRNPNYLNNGLVNFNGKYEGQPGGMMGPLRNKF